MRPHRKRFEEQGNTIRPEKLQFQEKGQNRNVGYKKNYNFD